MDSLPSTQQAIATPAKRARLVEVTVPVEAPASGEVVVQVEWTASTPLDLHRADGGCYINAYPFILGSGGIVGHVVAVASSGDLKGLQIGDKIMGYAFGDPKRANHKPYVTVPAYLISKMPKGLSDPEAVTVSVNVATVFHTATKNLGIELPWPIPSDWQPKHAHKPFLIWGAGSSVGIFALQVFKHWGFTNLLAVASEKHHNNLKALGAAACFDYSKPDVVESLLRHIEAEQAPKIPYIIDCIGSLHGTLQHIVKIAQDGSIVAVMLPVIVEDAKDDREPVYLLDANQSTIHPGQWAEGAVVEAVRTQTYPEVSTFTAPQRIKD